jgi:hypothetical protein
MCGEMHQNPCPRLPVGTNNPRYSLQSMIMIITTSIRLDSAMHRHTRILSKSTFLPVHDLPAKRDLIPPHAPLERSPGELARSRSESQLRVDRKSPASLCLASAIRRIAPPFREFRTGELQREEDQDTRQGDGRGEGGRDGVVVLGPEREVSFLEVYHREDRPRQRG